MSVSAPPDQPSFFDQEVSRLTLDIAMGFEELLDLNNVLNRKLEEVSGMKKEFATIADLWRSFHEVMRDLQPEIDLREGEGVPGTGGHVVQSRASTS
ncbi:hypothetical protein EXIGLDRAFT_763097 [Exidia glandulosa HHB12029]|uniref:DASH complex subunit DAD1 n=1 Tax=Exidia glandulosa HHB12029 TaxID=1314781 RepID=A0A165M7E1_EXIGL|nr:hypothetical protein EXIGLDRAFT_763097 [Exidia glandulosa HHB12029]